MALRYTNFKLFTTSKYLTKDIYIDNIERTGSFFDSMFNEKTNIDEIFLNLNHDKQYIIYHNWEKIILSDNFTHSFYANLGEEIRETLKKIKKLKIICEPRSLVFLPDTIRRFVTNELQTRRYYSSFVVSIEWQGLCFSFKDTEDNFEKNKVRSICEDFVDVTNRVIYSLKHELTLDTFKHLEYKSPEQIRKENQIMPSWAADILKGCIRAGASIVGGMIGANIMNNINFDFNPDIDTNLDLGNLDTGDFDTDFDTGDFDTGDFDTGDFDTGDFDTGDFDTDVNYSEDKESLEPWEQLEPDNLVQSYRDAIANSLTDGVTFGGVHYIDTGDDVIVFTEEGHKLGIYDVMLKNGQRGVVLSGTWYRIHGTRLGVHHYIKNI